MSSTGTSKTGLRRWLGMIWRIYRDPQTPLWAKLGAAALALLYLVSPVDLIPEMVSGPLGLLDDAAMVPLLLWLAGLARRKAGAGKAPSSTPADAERAPREDRS